MGMLELDGGSAMCRHEGPPPFPSFSQFRLAIIRRAGQHCRMAFLRTPKGIINSDAVAFVSPPDAEGFITLTMTSGENVNFTGDLGLQLFAHFENKADDLDPLSEPDNEDDIFSSGGGSY